MDLDLETRTCTYPSCPNAFRVLPTSSQRHCCILHAPMGLTEHFGSMQAVIIKRDVERIRRREKLIGRIRTLYASGLGSDEILLRLNDEGFRKPKDGQRLDAEYLKMIRWKHKITIPSKSKILS